MTDTLAVTAADVVRAARAELGTRWMHQGRLPGVALDCAGLIICAARALGLVAPDFDINAYSRVPDGSMLDLCGVHMQQVQALELGAVVAVEVERDPQHMGIIGDYRHGGWSLIHGSSVAQPPRVVETRLMWSRTMRLRGIYRLPSVAAAVA